MRNKTNFLKRSRRKLSEILYPTSITYDFKVFRVVTNKMDNGLKDCFCFNDILLTRKVKTTQLLNGCPYILEMPTGNKIGLMRKKNIYTKDFIFNSLNEDKELYPAYNYNLKNVKSIYRVVFVSGARFEQREEAENWDNFDEVEAFIPKTTGEEILLKLIINEFLNQYE